MENARGESQVTKDIVVKENAISYLRQYLLEAGKKVAILCDQDGQKVPLNLEGVDHRYLTLPQPLPLYKQADTLEFVGQEIVLAIGGESLISIAKFYAFKFECELIICPLKSFVDYTFSCFARLFDGITFAFYRAASPERIYVDTSLTDFSPEQGYYLAGKFLTAFDNLVWAEVYGHKENLRAKSYFQQTLAKLIATKGLEKENGIWTLIRLGLAMTFFGQTKYFMGAERAFADLLLCRHPDADFLMASTIGTKLLVNAYSCFFERPPADLMTNINRHIQKLSQFLKIPPTYAVRLLAPSQSIMGSAELKQREKEMHPYLNQKYSLHLNKFFSVISRLGQKVNSAAKGKFTAEEIESCFALSGCMLSRPCGLSLILMLGYLDKLL